MNCPKCNSEMWDNREDKKNPKSPDYKCKDKTCGHAIWLDKKQKAAPKDAPRAPKWTWQTLYRDYDRCWRLVEKVMVDSSKRTKLGFTTADLHAAAATVFIRATQDGVAEPPKPVMAAELSERPEALDDDEDDGLPF